MKRKFVALSLALTMLLGTTAFATEYTVKSGDNLSKIALSELGDASRWQEIYEANKDTIKDPNKIYIGQTLTIPEDETTEPSAEPSAEPSDQPAAFTYADTIAWDGQYDVVVIGFGGAGAVAARTAADEGANVLIVEKAPEGEEGGNTRYCGQLFVYGNGNYDNTLAYYKALAGTRTLPDAVLETYCYGITNLVDTVSEMFDIPKENFVDAAMGNATFVAQSPEYPELPGSESIRLMSANSGGYSDAYLWNLMRQTIIDRADSIDVWYESPAVHLIQDPVSKTILGVQVERNGETLNIRADNGVVMACGGFENNDELCETYLGITEHAVVGSLYNTGDGILMAQEVGAKMWHMDVYEGIAGFGGSCPIPDEGERGTLIVNPVLSTGSSMIISGAGTRFMNETESTRHGHVLNGDVYENPQFPMHYYFLLDEETYQKAMVYDANLGSYSFLQDYEYVTSASSLEELAEKMNMDYDTLYNTVNDFNNFVDAGVDFTTGRDTSTMEKFNMDQNVYAIEIVPNILNTQGGPERNEDAQIIGLDGEPIPHLYAAGEFGGITALQYQGGGNMAECIIFGQIAGKNAAAAKDDELPVLTAVTSDLVYTPGVVSDLGGGSVDVTLGDNEYLGVGTGGMGGDVYVKVTMDGDKIVKVEVVKHNETEDIGTRAVDALPNAIVEANSTEVDGVSGATMTSNAIKEAVKDALAQVK